MLLRLRRFDNVVKLAAPTEPGFATHRRPLEQRCEDGGGRFTAGGGSMRLLFMITRDCIALPCLWGNSRADYRENECGSRHARAAVVTTAAQTLAVAL